MTHFALIRTDGNVEAPPGEKGIEVEIEFIQPAALEKEMAITLREYGRTVATGTIIQLIAPE